MRTYQRRHCEFMQISSARKPSKLNKCWLLRLGRLKQETSSRTHIANSTVTVKHGTRGELKSTKQPSQWFALEEINNQGGILIFNLSRQSWFRMDSKQINSARAMNTRAGCAVRVKNLQRLAGWCAVDVWLRCEQQRQGKRLRWVILRTLQRHYHALR